MPLKLYNDANVTHTKLRPKFLFVRGTQARFRYLFSKGKRYGILAARNSSGLLKYKLLDVNTNSDEFIKFIVGDVMDLMNPFPGPNSVLVLDGASYHKSATLKRIANRYGIKIIFLPPYSPYLNPIELDFNTIKNYLKRHWHTARRNPLFALHMAMTEVVDVDVTEYMRSVGYFDFVYEF